MAERLLSPVKATVGFASESRRVSATRISGGAVFGYELPKPCRDIVAASPTAMAAPEAGGWLPETAVRGFLDGFW